MFSPLLLLAAEPATHGETSHVVTRLMNEFGINYPGLLAQMVNFSIVAYLLWRFAFKPVLATLDARQKKIESGLRYADEMKAKLEATQQESAGLLKKAQIEGAKIVEEARKDAKDFLDKQAKEAAEHANSLLVKAQQAIALERRKMLDQARGEIARLVVATTERVLAKRLSDADRAAYNETAAKELAVI